MKAHAITTPSDKTRTPAPYNHLGDRDDAGFEVIPKAKWQLWDTHFVQAEAAKGDGFSDSTRWVIPFFLQRGDTFVNPHIYIYLSADSIVQRAI